MGHAMLLGPRCRPDVSLDIVPVRALGWCCCSLVRKFKTIVVEKCNGTWEELATEQGYYTTTFNWCFLVLAPNASMPAKPLPEGIESLMMRTDGRCSRSVFRWLYGSYDGAVPQLAGFAALPGSPWVTTRCRAVRRPRRAAEVSQSSSQAIPRCSVRA